MKTKKTKKNARLSRKLETKINIKKKLYRQEVLFTLTGKKQGDNL